MPDELRGRVMGVYVSLLLGMMRVGSLLLGMLAEVTSAPAALAAFAVAAVAASLWVRRAYPELRAAA